MRKVRVSEVFEGIQGEGRFAGEPMLFIRFSGCTRECSFCDSLYHKNGRWVSEQGLIRSIEKSKLNWVCFTGGEPLLWREGLYRVASYFDREGVIKRFTLETNGDLLIEEDLHIFEFLTASPKDAATANKVRTLKRRRGNVDVKVVTDLNKVGVDMLEYATMLMPLTVVRDGVLDEVKSNQIRQRVWGYCVEHNLRYSPRLHIEVWGGKRRGK